MSKPLFKKPRKKKIFHKRKLDNQESPGGGGGGADEEDEPSSTTTNSACKPDDEPSNGTRAVVNPGEQQEESELSKIQSIKKNKRIKNQFRALSKSKKKKLNPNLHGHDGQDEEKDQDEQIVSEANKDLKQRLEGNFAITGNNATDDDGNILTRKHKLAMEQFIQSQMQKEEATDQDVFKGSHQKHKINNRDDLYEQILQESKELGKKTEERNDDLEEDDLGAGGAMLGGTGIAEVILPVEDKIKAARETELAAARLERRRASKNQVNEVDNGESINGKSQHDTEDLFQMLPMSFGSGPGKSRNGSKKLIASKQWLAPQGTISKSAQAPSGTALNKSAMPDIGSSYAHNFRLHNEEWINKKKQENQLQIQEAVEIENEADVSRVGFEAKRGLKTRKDGSVGDATTKGRKPQRAHDDMVYKKFVAREFHKK
mmetsp:Transcript_12256/g.18373  ORF Transcript_12256/g.18373 Transcript_12256/m.18373 type:complete len:430 (-) Transcript_12256:171-1460(-)